MGLFGKKKDKVVDWSENYRAPASVKKSSVAVSPRAEEENDSIGFLGNIANSNLSTSSDLAWDNDSSSQTVQGYQDKKQKLAKRLLDMTNKIEDLSNQIYHMNQRIELIEKKLKLNFQ